MGNNYNLKIKYNCKSNNFIFNNIYMEKHKLHKVINYYQHIIHLDIMFNKQYLRDNILQHKECMIKNYLSNIYREINNFNKFL